MGLNVQQLYWLHAKTACFVISSAWEGGAERSICILDMQVHSFPAAHTNEWVQTREWHETEKGGSWFVVSYES